LKQSRARWNAGTRLLVLATLVSFSWAMWKGDTVWRIWTFIGALASIALYLVRRRYDARREERLNVPAAGETPAWGLRFARTLRTSPVLVASWRFVAIKFIPFIFAISVLLAGVFVLNRLVFEILNVGGFACQASADATKLAIDEKRTVPFRTSDSCLPTKVMLEQGATYEIEIDRPEGWMDAGIPVPTTDGFASNAQAAPWYLALAVPMRREIGQNWFKPVAHVGEHARSEYVLGKKTQFVVKNRPGELFLFVNDAIIGVPGFWDYFYGNNRGVASVVIRKIGEAP
jgi:hypothetical protein